MAKVTWLIVMLAIGAGCTEPDAESFPASSTSPAAPVDATSGASMGAPDAGSAIRIESEGMQLELEELTRTGGVVWSLGFIGPDTMIFTERSGLVKTLNLETGAVRVIPGGPEVMQTETGGVFGVHVDPQFTENSLLYFSYVKAFNGGSVIALARAKLKDDELTGLVDLFVANNPSDDHAHWGSRVVMDGQRFLFMTVGDRHVPNDAQNLASHGGKVLRLREDGTAPADNPFAGRDDAAPEIWSIGHRNPQGLVIHPESGLLFEQEHGPTGGDEINLIEKGKNYGWPVITWGENIGGGQLPLGTEQPGMEQPLKYFKPGIAPSGMSFSTGARYPGWRGNIFSSTLRGHLNRLVLENTRVVKEERLLTEWGERLRDVVEGPDGFLYIATESGAIARIIPAQ